MAFKDKNPNTFSWLWYVIKRGSVSQCPFGMIGNSWYLLLNYWQTGQDAERLEDSRETVASRDLIPAQIHLLGWQIVIAKRMLPLLATFVWPCLQHPVNFHPALETDL